MSMRTGKKKRRALRYVLTGIGIAGVLAACVFFALLVKGKGSLASVRNRFVKTRGSLPAEYHPEVAETSGFSLIAGARPHATEATKPENHMLDTKVYSYDQFFEYYVRAQEISVDPVAVAESCRNRGIITFRGNYLRSLTSYGNTDGPARTLRKVWEVKTGRFLKDDGVNYWSGNGWTGQPLAVQWDERLQQTMNLYPEAKAKKGLAEVIYPGMDGKIRFLDMETGEATRPAINVGQTFKGTCSLHPDLPLLICGSGDSSTGPFGEQVSARYYIYSLHDGKKLYEFAANDPYATRRWHGFDSSPVFAPESDSVICLGENGVTYTVRLNSRFDEETGEVDILPEKIVRYIYDAKAAHERYEKSESDIGSGSESSPVVYGQYLWFGDNGGIFQCIDLNTMRPLWVQDLQEDINGSPVLEIGEDGSAYLYVGTTLKYHTDSRNTGLACVYKLNAANGEIVWRKPYEVHTVSGLAGGILSSGAPGDGAASEYIYFAVSKTPSVDTGYVVALRKDNGEEAWRRDLSCDAWSSPCLVHAADGAPRLLQCCGNGDVLLLDALTGELLSKVAYGANIESTPVIFGNRVAVGLRSELIVGMEIE